ncbi:hypothetical protein HDV00_009861 [Rhizophlyctis rosea]|nr:hypothetical protein HDV00_009861 [Rhizophlyctis rosea]
MTSQLSVLTHVAKAAGTLLAAADSNGDVYIYDSKGGSVIDCTQKFHMHREHMGLITSLKWNKKGDLFATSSMDSTAIVWDAVTGDKRQSFQYHSDAVMDVDWRDDTTIATGSTDKQIYVCQLGSPIPIMSWTAHEGDINAVKWDPQKKYLASASDDCTAAIWTMDSSQPLWRFSGHESPIQFLSWCGPLAESGTRPSLLTVSTENGMLRIWNTKRGECERVLRPNPSEFHFVTGSPNGLYFAAMAVGEGSSAVIYSLKDGTVVRSWNQPGTMQELRWNDKGDRLACTLDNGTITMLHVPECVQQRDA